MKNVSCDICEHMIQAESFQHWFEQAKEHYKQNHADFMESNKDKPKDDAMKWMEMAQKRFDEAPLI